MPARQNAQQSVTWEQVAAFRLARHHLLERAPTKSLVTVASDMGGAQAQLQSAAQISLGVRLRDLKLKQIEKALADRKLVKASCMRRTLFLVPGEELAVFSLGAASRARREVAWTLRQGVPEKAVHAAIDTTLSVLDQPRTRKEISEHVSRKLGVQKRDVHGGGWGRRSEVAAVPVGKLIFPVVDLVHLTADRGVVCYGPMRGNEPTFVRAEAWIPNWKEIAREEAEDRLLRRYLKSFGPATAEDFAAWAGMTLTEARAIWIRQQERLVQVGLENKKVSIFEDDIKDLVPARFERPMVRLLPYFDSFVLGHKERDQLVSTNHYAKVYRPQGWVAPVVIADGRVVAVWEHEVQKSRLRIRVKKFAPLSRNVQNNIQEEAQNLGRFLRVSDVEVRIGT